MAVLKNITQALTGAPDIQTAERKAILARQAVVDAAKHVAACVTARDLADESTAADAAEQQGKADAALIGAQRAEERALRQLQQAESRLQRAQDAAGAVAAADARKHLAGLVAARDRAGKQVGDAIAALDVTIRDLAAVDLDIGAVPERVRGADCVPGHNLGKGAIDMRVAAELGERGILGKPTGRDLQSFAAWLATGSDLLRARV